MRAGICCQTRSISINAPKCTSLNRPSPPRKKNSSSKSPPPSDRPCPPSQRNNSTNKGRPSQQQGQKTLRKSKFKSPLPPKPRIAIIGGGLSGLMCATKLAEYKIKATVFDTGEHGVGGRLGTRSSLDGSLSTEKSDDMVFDHAAQYFTCTDPEFQTYVDNWLADNAIAVWKGSVGELSNGTYTEIPANDNPRYYGVGGMRQFAEYLASKAAETEGLIDIQRPMWIDTIRFNPNGWQVKSKGKHLGQYDAVVIAHNGKCANRLTAPMGVQLIHSQLRRLKLSANWVLMAAFEQHGSVLDKFLATKNGKIEGAFVRDSEVLSWVGNNTAKLQLLENNNTMPQCWTLISTQQYGKSNKVPQENVPDDVASRVKQEMLDAFAKSLGIESTLHLPSPCFTRLQLWGAALPLNSPQVPCVWAAEARVGIVGDWVYQGGSMQSAVLSGIALANHISKGDTACQSVGLQDKFVKVAGGEEIGIFP